MRGLSGYSVLAAAAAVPSVLGGALNQHWVRDLVARQASASSTATATSTAFDAYATNNLGVYFGHAQNESNPSMYPLCTNSDVNIVIIGFIRQFNGPETLPTYDFGDSCTSDGTSSTTTCPELAANVSLCQSLGKKVFLSMGGSSSNITFGSSSAATEAAQTLWDVFGAGSNNNATIRPFGDLSIDGFDFDIEAGGSTDNFDLFAETLQGFFRGSSPARYISAAPLCANNTALPHGFYENTNFVWPRFYNAQACGVGSAGFNSSLLQWHDYLDTVKSNISTDYPLLYIGGLAFDNDNNGGGYVDPDEFASELIAIRPNISSMFGGVTLWEGTDALLTMNSAGEDYLNVSKTALNTVSGSSKSSKKSAGSRLSSGSASPFLSLIPLLALSALL